MNHMYKGSVRFCAFILTFILLLQPVFPVVLADRKTTLATQEMTSGKTRSTIYTTEKVEAARQNVEKYDWAKSIKYSIMNTANYYLTLGHDYLWNLVTDQSIPRGYAVNQPLGCLNCGKAIDKFGNYPYNANHFNAPWKLECPNCHMRFPTNDFNAYYKSGLDQHHKFNPDLADKSLLVNTLYPEKGEKWGVDDGYGYIDENGNIYTFIAYFNHWQIWYSGMISKALNSLRDAYIYSGNIKYAGAGAILLDRIADVYPDMDIWPYKIDAGFLNSNGKTNRGKIIGSIWETGLAEDFIRAYDAFYPALDDPEIIEYLSKKADQYHLGSAKKNAAGIRKNIEDGILRQIYPAVQNAQIRGNNGMHQSTLAAAAVVLDTMPETKEWLDFNFKSGVSAGDRVEGGNILATFVNDVDRDGFGNEASPGYNGLWLGQYIDVANILAGYDLYPAADLYENPKFKKMFYAMISVILTDKYSAIIGDTASTGNPTVFLNLNQTILAYERYKDPLLAQVIYFLNGNTTEGIHGDIFSADPLQVAQDIQCVIDEIGPLKLGSENVTGYGFSALRDGYNITYDLGINYLFKQLDTESSVEVKPLVNNRIELEAEQPGDEVAFRFNVLETDDYQIDLKIAKSGSYGKYRIYLDDRQIGKVDFYGSGSTVETLGVIPVKAGTHEIRFKCIGKSPESTGYKMALTNLLLYDPETQDLKDISELGDTQKALWMYYGISSGHGHADTLNIGINAFGLDLAPELGYPEYADTTPHRLEWVSNTISHNTVVVDQAKQDQSKKVEQPLHFDESEFVRLTDVDAPMAYASKDVDYRRTVAMIKINETDFYAVDFFRVQGGNDHRYSFHGAEGSVLTEGLDLVSQTDSKGEYVGTYAGPDTEFGIRTEDDTGNSGFQWLMNVRKDTTPGETFSVDWNVKDTWNALGKGKNAPTDIHVRLTMLEQAHDVAVATGIPPRNKQGNPKELEYLIARRSGNDLDSLFTSVIEPYKGERIIGNISKIDLEVGGKPYQGKDARGVKVEFIDGRVDYIVYSTDDNITLSVEDKFCFKGFFGVYSERNGIPFYSYAKDGEFIDGFMESEKARYTGTVTDFTREMSMENQITVRFDDEFDIQNLTDRYIYIQNDGIRNAVYKIKGVKKINNHEVVLDIGDSTTVRRWADDDDFAKGFNYDIAEGHGFVIPLSGELVSPVEEVSFSLGKDILTASKATSVSLFARYASGAEFSSMDGLVEIVSCNPKVATVKDGVVMALTNGKTELYAKIMRNGRTIRSNRCVLRVTVEKVKSIQHKNDGGLTPMPM